MSVITNTATGMNKKDLSERDICTKFITPAFEKAGWDVHSQIRAALGLSLRLLPSQVRVAEVL